MGALVRVLCGQSSSRDGPGSGSDSVEEAWLAREEGIARVAAWPAGSHASSLLTRAHYPSPQEPLNSRWPYL